MNYGQLRPFDIANGVGIRTSLFVTGCTHHCPDCFNREYMNFQAGQPWTEKETRTLLKYLENPVVEGLTVLGGEPFQNVEGLKPLLEQVRDACKKSIWIYSGYTLEEILQDEDRKGLLALCDVLVDGRFVAALKDLTLRFRGSKNQRILDVQKTLAENRPVLFME